ncbi:FtsX-like permease family protein [Gordonia sp. YC-JH1]|uniref:FtsX-like permease family protein n=1 Tax=Gordonia sp. YC-JH1 TaxID=2059875 RepID=UPI002D77C3B6|nr:FtsX-like permease family protein [Gordonia sp. YC-JH1]
MRATDYRLTAGSLRELSTVGVVCGLSAAYAGMVLTASDFLGRAGEHNGGNVGVVLGIVSSVFILIALFVAALVIGNGVDTVIAGRRKQLELLRLIGASSRQLRSSLVRGVAKVAAIGAGIGLVAGVTLADAARTVMVSRDILPSIRYSYLPRPPCSRRSWWWASRWARHWWVRGRRSPEPPSSRRRARCGGFAAPRPSSRPVSARSCSEPHVCWGRRGA